jgi:hypothetical protein
MTRQPMPHIMITRGGARRLAASAAIGLRDHCSIGGCDALFASL